MNVSLKKTVAGTTAALTLAFAVLAAAPASAGPGWGYHHPYGWGPYAAVGVLGLAAGAAIAANNYDCTRYQPIYDRWGNYIGRRPVNVCY
jgi:hypothetical protein